MQNKRHYRKRMALAELEMRCLFVYVLITKPVFLLFAKISKYEADAKMESRKFWKSLALTCLKVKLMHVKMHCILALCKI